MKEKINTLDNKTLKEIDLDKSIFSIEIKNKPFLSDPLFWIVGLLPKRDDKPLPNFLFTTIYATPF